MRVLLIEDEDRDRELITQSALFSAPGCEVVWSRHPDDALAKLEQGFDLVVLDLMFPGGSNLLYTAIHQHPLFAALTQRQIPVVAMSALLGDRSAVQLVNSLNVVALVRKADFGHDPASVDDALRRAFARAAPKTFRGRGAREVTWLHISDFHFGCRASGKDDREIVQEAFIRDLQRHIKQGAHFDWIFVTGDVAFSGKHAEYEQARVFLDEVLAVTGASRDTLHIVPGNHDLNRDLIDAGSRKIGSPQTKAALNQTFLESEGQLAILCRPFAAYREFVDGYLGSAPARQRFDDLTYVVADDARQVAIVGLNSALGSGLSLIDGQVADEARLFVGESRLRRLLAKVEPGWVTLVLSHHPLEYFVEFDRADVQRALAKHSALVLHGHQHLNSFGKQAEGTCSPLAVVRAGSVFQGREPVNSYNVASLDLDSHGLRVDYRRYSDRQDEFIKDLDATGDVGDGSLITTVSRRPGSPGAAAARPA